MSDTSFLLLLSAAPLVAFLLFGIGIAVGVHYWAKPRRHAKR